MSFTFRAAGARTGLSRVVDEKIKPRAPRSNPSGLRWTMPETTDPQVAISAMQHVAQLLQTPYEARDDEWTSTFSTAFLHAVFEVAEPEHFQGPDGVWYHRFLVPRTEQFQGMVPGTDLDRIIGSFGGIALFNGSDEPAYVFSPGDVLSLRLYGQIEAKGDGAWDQQPSETTFSETSQVLVGAPSESLLPSMCRQAAKHVMGSVGGVAQPGVLCFTMGDTPPMLCFNLFAEDFEDRNRFEHTAGLLMHYMPKHLRTRASFVNKGAFEDHMFVAL